MKTWAFIPARGGSQSIEMKNMLRFDKIPLVGWALNAALEYGFKKVIVSTDNETIAEYCKRNGRDSVEIVERPMHLRDGLSYPIQDVVTDYLSECKDLKKPDAIALFQPTSPFVRQYQIEHLLRLLNKRVGIRSAYTVASIPHNYHWINQRAKDDQEIRLINPRMRKGAYNKHRKDKTYSFGNLVITKCPYIKDGFFAEPSMCLEIDRFDAMDIDTIDDYRMAETLIKAGYWEGGSR